MARKERGGSMLTVVRKVVLLVCTGIILLPVAYTIMNVFMSTDEIMRYYSGIWKENGTYAVFHIFPDHWSLESLYEVLLASPDYLRKFWNSIGFAGAVVIGQLVISILAGYGFSKFCFPGRNVLFVLVVIIMMMPYQVTLVSNYIMLDQMGLTGSYAAVILPGIFSSFGVFLMKQIIDGIPQEIFEAARLDGAGQIHVLAEIVLPLAKGGMAALLILSFVDNWNMVEQPLVFLKDERMYPLSVFLSQSFSSSGGVIFACGLLAMLPVMLLYLYFQEELIEGISVSGIR